MTTWFEYKVIEVFHTTADELEVLNREGSQSWELVALVYFPERQHGGGAVTFAHTKFYFKRAH